MSFGTSCAAEKVRYEPNLPDAAKGPNGSYAPQIVTFAKLRTVGVLRNLTAPERPLGQFALKACFVLGGILM